MVLFQAPPLQVPPPAVDGVVVTAAPTAILSCRLDFDRAPTACVVVKATPADCGFGTAALRLAQHMKLDAEAARRAVRGRVEIPLSFPGVGACPRPDTP